MGELLSLLFIIIIVPVVWLLTSLCNVIEYNSTIVQVQYEI